MTTPLPSGLRRLFTRSWLDREVVKQGEQAGKDGQHLNPWPKGSVEHHSWKVGYNRTDDWMHVW